MLWDFVVPARMMMLLLLLLLLKVLRWRRLHLKMLTAQNLAMWAHRWTERPRWALGCREGR